MFGKSGKEERRPASRSRGYADIERERRPATVSAMAGSLSASGGGVGTAATGWASATVGGSAAVGGAGLAAIVGGHFRTAGVKRVFGKTDTVDTGDSGVELQGTTEAGGQSDGAAATVQDVVEAVGAVVDTVQRDVVNSATGIKTRIEEALGRILAAAPVTSHAAPALIEHALKNAIREAEHVRRAGQGSIDKAEDWAKGL